MSHDLQAHLKALSSYAQNQDPPSNNCYIYNRPTLRCFKGFIRDGAYSTFLGTRPDSKAIVRYVKAIASYHWPSKSFCNYCFIHPSCSLTLRWSSIFFYSFIFLIFVPHSVSLLSVFLSVFLGRVMSVSLVILSYTVKF